MSYNLLGYNFMNGGGYDPFGMNMTNSLYMMNFYEQVKNYYAGRAGKATDGETTGSGTEGRTSADFQTAFQEAFRKALQESMGLTDSTAPASQAASGIQKTATGTLSDRGNTVRNAYQAMNSYGSHPSRFWTSRFAGS